jgi:outer membrane protein assembly factor BamB
MLVALELSTGEVIWRSPNPRGWKMSHASIMPMEFAGKKMYVYCGDGGTAGVAVEDGTLLWDEDRWRENFATSPSPLPLPDGRILLSSGYDAIGALILQLKEEGGTWSVEHERELKRNEFNSEQQTPVLYEGYLYAVRKHRGGQLVCMDLQGQEVWNSGGDKFGHGPYLIADGMVIVLADDGTLTLAEASPAAYRPLANHRVFAEGHEAWGPMALAGGYLVLRDFQHMACVDLRGNK